MVENVVLRLSIGSFVLAATVRGSGLLDSCEPVGSSYIT